MKIAIHGHMGRDEALASRLRGHELHILGQWNNPGLAARARASGGMVYPIDRISNVETVADYVQGIQPDMLITHFDDALAAGERDAVERRIADGRMPDVWMPFPDRAASRIEWDKFYLRELVNEIDPDYNPHELLVETPEQLGSAIALFKGEGTEIALKPRNPTGGKGVKVQGKEAGFMTYDDFTRYGLEILARNDQTGLEIQEKYDEDCHEFTLQIFTDGTTMIRPPATYDYPYREDGDTGPGTGGMGTFSMEDGRLPFVTDEDYEEAMALSEKILLKLKERGHDYKGIFYPTFFKTPKGLKIVEVNARGGDPELINIVDLMEDDVDLAEVLRQIATGELTEQSIRYKKAASAMVYLVSPDYGYQAGPIYDFSMNLAEVAASDCRVRFAAAERTKGNNYRTVGSSRSVGLCALADTPWAAQAKIHQAIENGFGQPLPLQFRHDVADRDYIEKLA